MLMGIWINRRARNWVRRARYRQQALGKTAKSGRHAVEILELFFGDTSSETHRICMEVLPVCASSNQWDVTQWNSY